MSWNFRWTKNLNKISIVSEILNLFFMTLCNKQAGWLAGWRSQVARKENLVGSVKRLSGVLILRA